MNPSADPDSEVGPAVCVWANPGGRFLPPRPEPRASAPIADPSCVCADSEEVLLDVVDVAVVVNEAAFVDVDTEEDAGESFPVNDPPSTPPPLWLSALAAAFFRAFFSLFLSRLR